MICDTLFQILKASLFTDESVPLDDWKPVFTEMKAQTVAGLAAEWLKKHPLPDSGEWTAFCLRQQAQWVRVMHGQKQLLDLLEANGIPCIILKGAAAAMAYPHPSLRSMGDVDFLVKREDFERAAALLEENGYTLTHEKNPKKHHFGYNKNGILFELHWRIPIISDTDEKRMSVFEDGIDNREWHETEGYRIIGIFFRNKMTPKRFFEQRRKGIEQRELLEALGLRVKNKINHI